MKLVYCIFTIGIKSLKVVNLSDVFVYGSSSATNGWIKKPILLAITIYMYREKFLFIERFSAGEI
jgi:hypothetical protein